MYKITLESDGIVPIYEAFCAVNVYKGCERCPIGRAAGPETLCAVWVRQNPAKAAEIMNVNTPDEYKIAILPDGKHPLSPHRYVEKEVIKNATVQVLECADCGHVSIGWVRNKED